MTKAQIETLLSEKFNEFNDKMYELKNNYQKERQKLLNEYAIEHSEFKIGDILQCSDVYIKVEEILGGYDNYQDLYYPIYVGPQLTKQLKPKKDDSAFKIFGDGREIIKIK